MVGNLNTLAQESYTDMASDFWRLSGPDQFVCRFPEEIAYRLVWKTGRKKYFEFIHSELAEAEGVAPAPMALLIVALHDRDVIADDKVGEGTILPIRRVHVLVGDDVMGCALSEEGEAPGESRGEEYCVRHIARGCERRRDCAHHVVFPSQLLHHVGDVAHRQRHHDMGRPGAVRRVPGFCRARFVANGQRAAIFPFVPGLQFVCGRRGPPIADKVERGTTGRRFGSLFLNPHGRNGENSVSFVLASALDTREAYLKKTVVRET